MQLVVRQMLAVLAVVCLAPDHAASQSATSCTMTGPGSVPSHVVGGTADGAHTFVADGVRLWYCVAGRRTPGVPPVVFLHGGPGQGSYHFAAMTGPSLEPSLRLVYLDQRGSGRSERPWTHEYALQQFVDDIEALRLALGTQRIALIAHSFAGSFALEYAAKYPERVSRLVMVDAISDLPGSLRSQCALLQRTNPVAYARSGANGSAPATPAECDVFKAFKGREANEFFQHNMFPDSTTSTRLDSVQAASGLRNSGEISSSLMGRGGMMSWHFEHPERLTMPVLIIAGRHDEQVGLDPQRDLLRRLPNARMLEYEHSGHFPYLDEPLRFASDVRAFLAPK